MAKTDTEQGVGAESRAAAISGALVVRQNRDGSPVWSGSWRDSTGRRMLRKLGPAWLHLKRNPFLDEEADEQPARGASWSAKWESPKRKKADPGYLRHDGAVAALKQAILEREHEVDDEREQKAVEQGGPLLFEDAADAWLKHRVTVGGIKPSTKNNYEAMLRREDDVPKRRGSAPRALLMREFAGKPLKDIDTETIEGFLSDLDDDDKLSARSVNAYRQVLNAIFAHAVKRGQLTSNPVDGTERRREGAAAEIVTYSVEEVRAISRVLESGAHRSTYTPAGGAHAKAEHAAARAREDQLDATAILVAAFCGLRQGEIVALRWRDVDFGADRIVVQRNFAMGEETSTKGRRARSVPMSAGVAQALAKLGQRDHFTGNSDLVFTITGEHLDASALRRRYNKARDKAREKNADMPRLRFHDLRHTFGTLAASGFDLPTVQRMLGHQDARTTARYQHARPAADDAERLSRIFGDDVNDESTPAAAG